MRPFSVIATFAAAALAVALAVICFTRGDVTLLHLRALTPMLSLDAGLTPLAGPFLGLVCILSTAIAFWSTTKGRPTDNLLVAGFAFSMISVLIAQSVAFFFLAWEAMSLTSVFLVAANHERRGVRRAAFTYLFIAQAGGICVLASLAVLASQTGDASFTSIAHHAAALPPGVRNAAFVLALIGFGSKAGVLPLHFWLPRAHPVAPPSASALLSGAMLKVAIYGLLLVAFELAAPGPTSWGVAVIVIGTVSAFAGVLYALVDHDLKRLLAYHSIENVGIILIGAGVALVARAEGALALAALAMTAALFHSVNHGIFKGLLFLGAGNISDAAGTVDLEKLGGLGARLVWTSLPFLIGCAAITGLPPLNGFASEWLTFQAIAHGISTSMPPIAFVLLGSFAGLALTGGLAAACFVKVYGMTFLGRPRRADPRPIARERFDAATVALGLLGGLCVVLGVAPMLAIAPLSAGVSAVLAAAPSVPAALPLLPATLLTLPLAGAVVAYALAVRRTVRAVGTWTCGSPVTASAQYSATAFSKPLRTIFGFILKPDRRVRVDTGRSRWFPTRIVFRVQSRYLIDEAARRFAAATLRLARSSRAVQSGSLRLYIAYAVVAVVVAAIVAR